jgi:hypothetical protein
MYIKDIRNGCTLKILEMDIMDVHEIYQKCMYIKDVRNGCTLKISEMDATIDIRGALQLSYLDVQLVKNKKWMYTKYI